MHPVAAILAVLVPSAKRALCAIALSCLAVSPLAGCRGGWNEKQLYVKRWKPAWRGQYKEATYRVGSPGPDWRPHPEKNSQVAWQHRDVPAIISVRSQCQEHGDSSLEQFTDHLRIDFGEWKVTEQRFVTLINREALRSTVEATLDGAPVKLEVIVLKKNGCLFDLGYYAIPSAFADGMAAFEQVVEGFEFPVER